MGLILERGAATLFDNHLARESRPFTVADVSKKLEKGVTAYFMTYEHKGEEGRFNVVPDSNWEEDPEPVPGPADLLIRDHIPFRERKQREKPKHSRRGSRRGSRMMDRLRMSELERRRFLSLDSDAEQSEKEAIEIEMVSPKELENIDLGEALRK